MPGRGGMANALGGQINVGLGACLTVGSKRGLRRRLDSELGIGVRCRGRVEGGCAGKAWSRLPVGSGVG